MIADPRDAKAPPIQTSPSPGVRTVDAAELFAGGKEIAIVHDGAVYRMKITRQGKLILNK